MVRRILIGSLAVMLFGSPQSTRARSQSPEPVSPGSQLRVETAADSCPTFSWGAIADAESYELLVYRLDGEGHEDEDSQPVLHETFSGSVHSWTPSLDRCLQRGSEYAWSMKAVNEEGASDWSAPSLFRVPRGPGTDELEAALEVVRQYLVERSAARQSHPGDGATASALPSGLAWPSAEASQGEIREMGGDATAAPGPRAPVPPLEALGVASTVVTNNDFISVSGDAVAVKGVYLSSDSSDHVGGYLGVAVPAGAFEGLEILLELYATEIGVIGFSANSSSDNVGVVGVATGDSKAGRFFSADETTGAISNEVLLATAEKAVDAKGPISWECPASMDQAGTWCISNAVRAAQICSEAIVDCHGEGGTLCPLAALMTCDLLDVRKGTANSCGTVTDADIGVRTLSVDNYPNVTGVFDVLIDYYGDDNSMSRSTCATSRPYFCCKLVVQ